MFKRLIDTKRFGFFFSCIDFSGRATFEEEQEEGKESARLRERRPNRQFRQCEGYSCSLLYVLVQPAEAPIDNAQVEEAKSSETSPAEQAAEVQQTAEVQENAEPATESKVDRTFT